jgi:hypothetical protein
MREAFDDSLITGWEDLEGGLSLPDEDDRHVVAAAIKGSAQAIITANLADFPAAALGPLGLESVHPDNFLLDQLDRHHPQARLHPPDRRRRPAGTRRQGRRVLHRSRDHGPPRAQARHPLRRSQRPDQPQRRRPRRQPPKASKAAPPNPSHSTRRSRSPPPPAPPKSSTAANYDPSSPPAPKSWTSSSQQPNPHTSPQPPRTCTSQPPISSDLTGAHFPGPAGDGHPADLAAITQCDHSSGRHQALPTLS